MAELRAAFSDAVTSAAVMAEPSENVTFSLRSKCQTVPSSETALWAQSTGSAVKLPFTT